MLLTFCDFSQYLPNAAKEVSTHLCQGLHSACLHPVP